MFKKILLFFILLSAFIVPHSPAFAGFGVSPPFLASDKILPGSHYEQTITLLRSSADDELMAEAVINALEIEDWITINKGMFFELPAGKTQIPIIISIDPPENAALGSYQGKININVSAKGGNKAKGIELAVGAQINIDISLTRDIYRDFSVRAMFVDDLELPQKPWDRLIFSWLFRQLKITLKIENTGNVKIAPTKVSVDVYDITEEDLLESAADIKIKKIPPFQTKNAIARVPLKTGPGQYWAKIKVYKDKDIVSSEKIAFTILSPGAFKKSDILPWVIILASLILIWLIIFFVFRIKIAKHIFKFIKIIYLISSKSAEKLKIFYTAKRIRFWQWFYDKILKHKK